VWASAVVTRRSRSAPDIPTFDEQGVKGFLARSFIGIVAPAKAPAEALAKLQAAIAAGVGAGTDAAAKLIATGSEIATPEQMTPAGFADFIKRDLEDMRAAAKLAGLGK